MNVTGARQRYGYQCYGAADYLPMHCLPAALTVPSSPLSLTALTQTSPHSTSTHSLLSVFLSSTFSSLRLPSLTHSHCWPHPCLASSLFSLKPPLTQLHSLTSFNLPLIHLLTQISLIHSHCWTHPCLPSSLLLSNLPSLGPSLTSFSQHPYCPVLPSLHLPFSQNIQLYSLDSQQTHAVLTSNLMYIGVFNLRALHKATPQMTACRFCLLLYLTNCFIYLASIHSFNQSRNTMVLLLRKYNPLLIFQLFFFSVPRLNTHLSTLFFSPKAKYEYTPLLSLSNWLAYSVLTCCLSGKLCLSP